MPLRICEESRFIWFIIDGSFRWDKRGWWLFFRTPLFGFGMQRNWPSITCDALTKKVWLGLLCRVPTYEGDIMYRWHWEKEMAEQSLFDEATH